MFKNIPWSKYKKVEVSGNIALTEEQMDLYKKSAESTLNMDWDRLVPENGSTLIHRMLFKQDDMNVIYEDLVKIAKECPFLNIVVHFSHDYTAQCDEYIFSDDDMTVRDQHICTMTVDNGKVSLT